MYSLRIKFRRVAIAILAVFLVADFSPHPALSQGLILTALSRLAPAHALDSDPGVGVKQNHDSNS
ncbi:MAG: hypothetical protein AAFY26_02450 [Cyanobacteria bacterium J06638_22]